MASHLDLILDRRTVAPGICSQIEQYVYRLVKDQFHEKLLHVTPPISNHAVGERSKANGGYSGHIYQCGGDPEFLGVCPPLDRAPLGNLTRALWRLADSTDRGCELDQYLQASLALPAVRMVEKFVRDAKDGVQFVHRATPIGEQGDKCRVITVPPASLFAAGDVCRQRTWPGVKRADPRLFAGDEPAKAAAARIGLGKGEVYVSADLTKATDGFAHDAVRSVLNGLRRAGLDPHTVSCMAETLGVGQRPHLVEYKLSDLPPAKRVQVVRRFETVLGADGKAERVRVPLVRGILMGTPCSFTILSLLNGWCAKPMGSGAIICGDDVAAACTPESVDTYRLRVEAVGSGLHKRKTFIGHRGLLFCELYVLPEFRDQRCFEPVPLKSLAKDGDGTFDTKHFDSFLWKRMDRACRVLWRDSRARARRLGRWPQLPVELGGLGHPSSGKMGAVPGSVRNRLASLIKNRDVPMKKISTWTVRPQPLSWAEFQHDNEVAWTLFESTVGTVDALESAGLYEEPHFVSYHEARTYVAIQTNEFYTAHGGRFKPFDQRKFEPGEVLYPAVGSVQYSSKAPMSMVAREYLTRLREEGEYLPYDAVRKIRQRTGKSGGPS